MVNRVQLTFFVCSCVPVTDNFMVCVFGERERMWLVLNEMISTGYEYSLQIHVLNTAKKSSFYKHVCPHTCMCVCMTTVSLCRP